MHRLLLQFQCDCLLYIASISIFFLENIQHKRLFHGFQDDFPAHSHLCILICLCRSRYSARGEGVQHASDTDLRRLGTNLICFSESHIYFFFASVDKVYIAKFYGGAIAGFIPSETATAPMFPASAIPTVRGPGPSMASIITFRIKLFIILFIKLRYSFHLYTCSP